MQTTPCEACLFTWTALFDNSRTFLAQIGTYTLVFSSSFTIWRLRIYSFGTNVSL